MGVRLNGKIILRLRSVDTEKDISFSKKTLIMMKIEMARG